MKELLSLLPEIILLLTLIGIVAAEIGYHGEKLRITNWIASFGLGATLVQVILLFGYAPQSAFGGSIEVDPISLVFKLFFVFFGVFLLGVTRYSKEIVDQQKVEQIALILAAVLALNLLSMSSDLIVIFLSLQFLNVAGFLMAGMRREQLRSTEAALKFYLFAVVSATLFMVATALIFIQTQSLKVGQILLALEESQMSQELSLLIFGLFFLSMTFYLASIPLYFWFPDSVEGSPTPSSIFLAVGMPATAVVVFVRFFVPLLWSGQQDIYSNLQSIHYEGLFAVTAGATLALGAILAIRQESAKRLIAYLALAESGFLLLGFLVLDSSGLSAVIYHLFSQAVALSGAFWCLSVLRQITASDQMSVLNGIGRRVILESTLLILFLGALIGFPPFPSFLSKFLLIGGVIQKEWYLLGALAIVSSVIAIGAFARLVFILVGNESPKAESETEGISRFHRFAMLAMMVPVLLLSWWAETILRWTGKALEMLLT